jgi:hypothetical protein
MIRRSVDKENAINLYLSDVNHDLERIIMKSAGCGDEIKERIADVNLRLEVLRAGSDLPASQRDLEINRLVDEMMDVCQLWVDSLGLTSQE